MTLIENINVQIANISNSTNVLYFLSDDRNIIDKVINLSVTLSDLIKVRLDRKDFEYTEKGVLKYLKSNNLIHIFNKNLDKKDPDNNKYEGVYILKDFQVFDQSERQRMIKLFFDNENYKKCILLISSVDNLIPNGFENDIELINVPSLGKDDIRELCKDTFDKKLGVDFADKFENMYSEMIGLNEDQIEHVIYKLNSSPDTKSKLIEDFNEYVAEEKVKIAAKDNTITIKKPVGGKVDGYDELIKWVDDHKEAFIDDDCYKNYGISSPKGILIVGLPGTGKSAAADEVAIRFSKDENYPIPVVDFKIENIQSSYLGETEKKFQRYLKKIDDSAPCVLRIDEIEKTLSFKEGTHEVKRHMLSQLLMWMQERKSKVFLYVTANSIEGVPPELIRDGRLNERFFAFLPSADDICRITINKITKLKKNTNIFMNEDFDTAKIKSHIEGILDRIAMGKKNKFFTGANIEKIIDNVNISLKNDENKKTPYSFDDYKEQLEKEFNNISSYGETNMDTIVDMWIAAKDNKYKMAYGGNIIPFDSFNGEELKINGNLGNTYDQYMRDKIQQLINERIENKNRIMTEMNKQTDIESKQLDSCKYLHKKQKEKKNESIKK